MADGLAVKQRKNNSQDTAEKEGPGVCSVHA